jgi:predicted metal-binding membrane protein
LDRLSAALDRGIEAAARNERRVALCGLAAVVALAWLWLWREAGAMAPGSMAMATMPRPAGTGELTLLFVMWAVMMAGMMLPSAAPAIVLYGAMVRKNGARGTALPALSTFAGGYLLAWTVFSAAATLLQAWLERASLLTPTTAAAHATLAAFLLIGAGVYQLTPLKQACLAKCRDPLGFFLTHWRAGAGGALRMGVVHGAYCVGCCWALMLVLFVAGVMNLAWVGLIAAFVLVEKLFRWGRAASYAASAALMLAGIVLLARA